MLAQAATLLAEGQGLLQSGAEADGLARLSGVRASFPGTAPARDAAVLTARTHQNARRWSDATEAWLDAARDGVGSETISEGLIQTADGAARQRTGESDVLARRALGEILDRYPSSVRALRALQMKMALEDRMKLKEADVELNGTAPASLLTLRKAARAPGAAPVVEFALWRLGQEYRDRRLYDLAAATFTDLATRFPDTRYDAWFSAAELFEKQLKDSARAREAYGKVPAASPRYEAAQKKLASA
jgi:TolA-binding protein